jgi:hypothetical protein
MAYDLENFNDFISRENEVLGATLFAGGDTAKFARFMSGIKGSTEVPYLSGQAKIQSGNCNTPSGDVVGDLVTLTVKPFTNYKSFCGDDLEQKFPATELAPGSYNNSNGSKPWEEKLVETELASISEQMELLYWQGDTAGSELNLFDGFIKQVDANADVLSGNTSSATEITKTNVKGLVEDMRDAVPAKVKRSKDFVIVVGDDVFDKYIQAEKADNLYHYAPEHSEGVYRIGGSGAMLIREYGLDSTDRMFASVGSNFIVGNDLEKDSEVAEMFYDQTTDKTYLRTKGKVGVTIQNANEIAEFTLSA